MIPHDYIKNQSGFRKNLSPPLGTAHHSSINIFRLLAEVMFHLRSLEPSMHIFSEGVDVPHPCASSMARDSFPRFVLERYRKIFTSHPPIICLFSTSYHRFSFDTVGSMRVLHAGNIPSDPVLSGSETSCLTGNGHDSQGRCCIADSIGEP